MPGKLHCKSKQQDKLVQNKKVANVKIVHVYV